MLGATMGGYSLAKILSALVTLLVYALPLHGRQLPAFRRPLFLHAYLLAAFVAVLMTWAGVNLLMGGLHSYA